MRQPIGFKVLQSNAELATQAKGNSNSTFGDLQENTNYVFEITEVKFGMNSKANPMITLVTKTVTGKTGIGTRVRTWYSLNVTEDGSLDDPKGTQSKQLMQLAGALDVTLDDIIADNWTAYLKEFAARIEENNNKRFVASVREDDPYTSPNGKTYKNWRMNSFSITPVGDNLDVVDTSTPTDSLVNTEEVSTDVTTTSADAIEDQYQTTEFDV